MTETHSEMQKQLSLLEGRLSFGALDQVIQQLHAILNKTPIYPAAWRLLGIALNKKGDKASAQKCFYEAFLQDPCSISNLTNLGFSLLESDNADAALPMLRQAFEQENSNPDVIRLFAKALASTGKSKEALQLLNKIRRSDYSDELHTYEAVKYAIQSLDYSSAVKILNIGFKRGVMAPSLIVQAIEVGGFEPLFDQFLHYLDASLSDGIEDAYEKYVAQICKANLHYRIAEKDKGLEIALDAKRKRAKELGLNEGMIKKDPVVIRQPVYKVLSKTENGQEPPVHLFLGPSRSGKTLAEKQAAKRKKVLPYGETRDLYRVAAAILGSKNLPNQNRLDLIDERWRPEYQGRLAERFRLKYPKIRYPISITSPGLIFELDHIKRLLPSLQVTYIRRSTDELADQILLKAYKSGHEYSYYPSDIKWYIERYTELIGIFSSKFPESFSTVSFDDLFQD